LKTNKEKARCCLPASGLLKIIIIQNIIMNTNKNSNTLLMVGAAAAGYFLILKPFLEKVGLKKSADVLATEAKDKKLVNQYVIDTQKKHKPTKSDSEWKIIADQIYHDFALLFKYFAKRQEYFFGINSGGLKNLTQFIISNLSKDRVAKINADYAAKKMKFRFLLYL
jgi:hypothetical protein